MTEKTKQLKVVVPEEIHRRFRIALAEDQSSFATWMYTRLTDYLLKKGKLEGKEGSELVNRYINNGEVYEDEKPVKAKSKPTAKRKGKGA